MQLKRVVVTGIGALTPIGNNATDYWNALLNGVSGADYIKRFDASKHKTQFACEVKNLDVTNFLDKKEARKLDPFAQFALICSDEVVKDCGINLETVNKDRVGVIWASGIGGLHTFQEEVMGFAKGDGTPRFNPFFIPKMILDIAAGHISMRYGFRGVNYATVSACASSSHALICAFDNIRMNRADMILTGGSESAINESGVGGFNAMHALSTRNDSPQTASRAKIYAEIVGGGMTADAHHITAPHPEGLGALNVMKNALTDAGLKPEDLDYINVHGTSTPLGDVSETKAIQQIFGEHAFKLNISSTKSMTGHLLGGAGAIEAIATLLAVQNDVCPPTINHFTDDPQFDSRLNFTFGKAQKRTVNAALSNTFGFGGHNASVIFKKFAE